MESMRETMQQALDISVTLTVSAMYGYAITLTLLL